MPLQLNDGMAHLGVKPNQAVAGHPLDDTAFGPAALPLGPFFALARAKPGDCRRYVRDFLAEVDIKEFMDLFFTRRMA